MSTPLFNTENTTSAANSFSRLWITPLEFLNGLCTTGSIQPNNLWRTRFVSLNSLWTTSQARSNNFVQLKHLPNSSAQSPLEQRGEQPVFKLVQQLLNKLSEVVHDARTIFEQLLANPYLFKRTNVSSSAFAPHCASRKPLNHNSFSTLSTIY